MKATNHLPVMYTLLISLITPTMAQQPTLGPLAPISFASLPAYSSARPCAAGCMVYNGGFQCGLHGGYNDLGNGLACGCTPTNNCWCSEGNRDMASSFVSSCVSSSCGTKVDWVAEATGMLGLWEGYCATATVELEGTKTTAVSSRSRVTSSSLRVTGSADPAAVAETETASSTPPAADRDDGGLQRSDIVALAASLGVGIPSLLIALITLCVQIRKRRRIAAETQAAATIQPASQATSQAQAPSTGSNTAMLTSNPSAPHSQYTPTPPPVMDEYAQAELAHLYAQQPVMQNAQHTGYFDRSKTGNPYHR